MYGIVGGAIGLSVIVGGVLFSQHVSEAGESNNHQGGVGLSPTPLAGGGPQQTYIEYGGGGTADGIVVLDGPAPLAGSAVGQISGRSMMQTAV